MNASLRTFSYRPKLLNYDSLQALSGCLHIGGGINRFSLRSFNRLCVIKHSESAASDFNQSPKLAFAWGPRFTGPFQNSAGNTAIVPPDAYGPVESVNGARQVFDTLYAAWVSTTGIRVTQASAITLPAAGLGVASQLFPASKPDFLSLGFSESTNMCLATETEGTIILRHYTASGVKTVSWLGKTPLLFNTGLLSVGRGGVTNGLPDASGISDLACLYTKVSRPREIFCRLLRDGASGFGTEYVLNEKLPHQISTLVSLDISGLKVVLLARAKDGRDATFYSEDYSHELGADAGTIDSEFTKLEYFDITSPASGTDLDFDKSKITSSLDRIEYLDTIAVNGSVDDSQFTSEDKPTLASALSKIEYL